MRHRSWSSVGYQKGVEQIKAWMIGAHPQTLGTTLVPVKGSY